MLYCDRIDINEEIDLAKSSNSKECMIGISRFCMQWLS